MADDPRPVFLARESYRRRRLADAASLVPLFGTVALLLPALWADGSRTAGAMVYVFSVWAVLIIVMFVMSRRLSSREDDGTPDETSER